MLKVEDTVLLVIDVQEKIASKMYEKEKLFKNLQTIIKGIQILEIPILWVEEKPEWLGGTVPEIKELLNKIQPIRKLSFSCGGDEYFRQTLKSFNRKQVLTVGIETHICVYQTAVDLQSWGYGVHLIVDAVSSRTQENKQIGLEKIKRAGAELTSVETVLFELLKMAEGEKFKEILKIVK